MYVLDRVANERNARHLRFLVVSSMRKDKHRSHSFSTLFAVHRVALKERGEEESIKLFRVYDTVFSKKNRRHGN